MPSITGIELAPDSCVLTRVRPLPGGTEISALHTIDRAAWPAHDVGLAAALREVRRRKRFPRRACVVLWNLSEPAPIADPHVHALLKPVIAAGFRVERVLTPPQALAALAATRPRTPGAGVVWLSLNTHGVAMAIVRDGELLFSRTFEWTFSAPAAGPRAEMLQRYSMVAHLAPEVHRGIATVAQTHRVTVATAVTCGDLPDLRSLTMPLIEELDLEVETLDSTEGLISTGGARTDRFAETVPALRLAVAAAGTPRSSRKPRAIALLFRAAAAVAVLALAGWSAQRYWSQAPVKPVSQRLAVAPAPRPGVPPPPKPIATPPSPSTLGANLPKPAETKTVEATPQAPPPVAPKLANQNPVVQNPIARNPIVQNPIAQNPIVQNPIVQNPIVQNPIVQNPIVQNPIGPNRTRPVQTAPRTTETQTSMQPPSPTLPEPRPVERAASEPVQPVVSRTDVPTRRIAPLKEAVPTVESILLSRDRRVAIVGGAIVGVGDSVGSRVVVSIDRTGVVLREPSGHELRISLRPGAGA